MNNQTILTTTELISGKPQSFGLPEEWQITNDYNSHRPILYLAAMNTDDWIVEAGMGYGSTPLLRSFMPPKKIASYESNKDWAQEMCPFVKYAGICHVSDWLRDGIFPDTIGVLFVDLSPGEMRKPFIEKYKNIAKLIVIHDTEDYAQRVYDIVDTLNSFKYRLDYKPEKFPGTSLVSNQIDVSKWIIPA